MSISKLPKPQMSLDEQNLLEAMSYISERFVGINMYITLKVFYVADKMHMERYGRFIFKDNYCAMRKGPVPSRAYDLIKDIRNNTPLPDRLEKTVDVSEKYIVTPLRPAYLGMFSESDTECLDEVIELGKVTDLGDLSHDDAWEATPENMMMPPESIISTLKDAELLLDLQANRYA